MAQSVRLHVSNSRRVGSALELGVWLGARIRRVGSAYGLVTRTRHAGSAFELDGRGRAWTRRAGPLSGLMVGFGGRGQRRASPERWAMPIRCASCVVRGRRHRGGRRTSDRRGLPHEDVCVYELGTERSTLMKWGPRHSNSVCRVGVRTQHSRAALGLGARSRWARGDRDAVVSKPRAPRLRLSGTRW